MLHQDAVIAQVACFTSQKGQEVCSLSSRYDAIPDVP